jgi:predicted TIM-barrel fold metal-dependent hydrolase
LPEPKRRARRLVGWGAVLLGLAAAEGCDSAAPPPVTVVAPKIIDMHVHLTDAESVQPLLALMDRHGVERTVILASPDRTSGRGGVGMSGHREGNEVVLAAAAAHAVRFIPFVTLDLGADDPEYLASLRGRGACGVKIYQGHHDFHGRPLDDPSYRPLWEAMARASLPVLLHVNTVRYRAELEAVLRAFPALRVVCAHLCGSRTDLDRLESIMTSFPELLVDTSHGSAAPAADGFAYLEANQDRFRGLLARWPGRFLFGSDLVTKRAGPTWRGEWDLQVDANQGLLTAASFRFWRGREGQPGGLALGEYRGLALPPSLSRAVLGENAARWLGGCLR